ncbi:MAG: RHS repeat protein [Alphaproteobacteria bacterium]|nr:RHS repeat protein [Alphaproteobacteria bacterium]
MHRIISACLALVLGVFFSAVLGVDSSKAGGGYGSGGYWIVPHLGTQVSGNGGGGGLAVADQRYVFPYSQAPTFVRVSPGDASATSYANNLGCSSILNDGQPCGGSAIHVGCNGTFWDALYDCRSQINMANCNGATGGNPVEITTGEKVQRETDWTSGGVDPLVLTRLYRSNSIAAFAPNYTRLGIMWRTNFDGAAKFAFAAGQVPPNAAATGDKIFIALPDGNEYLFLLNSSGIWLPAVPDPAQNTSNGIFWDLFRNDIDIALTTTATSVDLRNMDGTHYVFDAQGQMTKIVYPDGYTQTLTYVAGVNTLVTDSLGRKLVFKYDTSLDRPNYLTAAITPDGKEIDYTYVNRADPALGNAVVTPSYWTLGSVIYPDNTPASNTDNPRRTYGYLNTDVNFPFALTSITDERGVLFASWTYDAQGRALSSEHSGGQEHFDFAYDDVNNQVTVTNPLGRKTVYTITPYLGMIRKISAVNGIATTNCAASNTVYAYDANGFRSQATDAEGRITQWTRNARGLPTTTVEGYGTAAAKTTTTVWDATRPLPTQIAIAGLTTNMTYNSAGQVTQIQQVDTTTTTIPYSTNGQTRTTAFNYTPFTAPVPPAVAPSGAALGDVALALANPGAEAGNVTGWTSLNSTSPVTLATGSPCASAYCFTGSGTTNPPSSLPLIAYQDVAVPAGNIAEVDAGKRAATVSWNQFNSYNRDEATVRMLFLDASGTVLASGEAAPQLLPAWTVRSKTLPLPALTRTIRVEMVVPAFYYYWLTYAYFDDFALKLTANGTASATPFLTVANPDGSANNAGGSTANTAGWTVTGTVSTPQAYPCQAFSCFADGNTGNASNDQISQDIAIPSDRFAEVDAKARAVELQWMDQSNSTLERVVAQIDFLDAGNAIIAGASSTSPALNFMPDTTQAGNLWAQRLEDVDVPVGARKLRLTFQFYHNGLLANTSIRSYITAISLQMVGRAQPAGSVNLLTSVDGPLAGTGDTVTYAYDASGNLSQVTNEVGLITKITAVDGAGRPTTVQGPDGVNTTLAYDPLGRLTSITVNPGASQALTSIAYDAAGDVTKVTQPDGSYLQYAYDNAKRISVVTNTVGETVTYTYNANSEAVSATTKASGGTITRQMSMVYDELGRLLKSIGAATQTTVYSYDRTDNLTQTKDPRSNLYGYAYDSVNRLVQTKNEENATVNLTRNGQDKVTAYQDPRAITTSYVRKGFGEVIQEVSPDAGTTTYTRDARGLVTSQTDGRNVVTNRSYDNAGRLLTETYPAAVGENVTYAYDSVVGSANGKGRLTSITDQSGSTTYTYNALGQVVTDKRVIAAKTYTTSYAYDAAGHVSQITYPSGRIVIYARNSLGQVTGVTTKQNATAAVANVATGITYAPMSNLVTGLTHGNGLVTTAAFDQDYRIASLKVANGATNVSSLTYAYADGINLTGITDGVTAANSVTLTYSAANRLATAVGPWGTESFTYDAVGNRLNDNLTSGTTTTTRLAAYPATSNRITSLNQNGASWRSYVHDLAGNITNDNRPGEAYVFTYNNRGRPASLTRNAVAYATYGYNALQQMVTRSTSATGGPTGQVAYVYDLDGHLIEEATASTGAATRDYIWLASNDNQPVDMPLAVVDGGTTLSMVHTDHLGRPIKLTSAAKAVVFTAVYKPFGEVYSTSASVASNLRFPGQYFLIETGFAYNWHRFYDAVTGRYTQSDPLGLRAGMSRYGYGYSSPFRFTDRTGLEVESTHGYNYDPPKPDSPSSSTTCGSNDGPNGPHVPGPSPGPNGPDGPNEPNAGGPPPDSPNTPSPTTPTWPFNWAGSSGGGIGGGLGFGGSGSSGSPGDNIITGSTGTAPNVNPTSDPRPSGQQVAITADQHISLYCLGSVRTQFPKEFLDWEVEDIASCKTAAGKKAWKLLNDNRFRK